MSHQKQRRTLSLIAGLAGLATGAGAVALWRAHQRRIALARRAPALNARAVADLGVPAHSTFVNVNDLHLHAVIAGPGDGPLAVLLHGFPENWYSWRHQIPELVRAGYRVVVPDQRGYNFSDKPFDIAAYRIDWLVADVRALIRALGRNKATIVGHDWGGVVAWRFAMDCADMVRRLVVLNAPHPQAYARELRENPEQQRKSWYVAAFQLPALPERLLTLDPVATARRFFRDTAVEEDAFSETDLELMAAAIAQPRAMRSAVNWYRAALRYPALNAPRRIDAPTTLIWGVDDIALSQDLTEDLDDWVPDLTVHLIESCGHWVQNEAPDEVNGVLVEAES